MKKKSKIKRLFFIFIIVLVSVTAIVILFISPITKYLIEKYDEKYTGREIKMDWSYVNPFTGYVHISGLKIYELKSDSVFFSAAGLSINFALLKMLSGTYEISNITFDNPKGIVIQNKKHFNYSDLVEKFSSKEKPDVNKDPVHFNILDIKINGGVFYFSEQLIPVNYFIKKVNFESEGLLWNSDTIGGNFSFQSGIGPGDMKGNFTINITNLDYRTYAVVQKFDLKIIEQYLKGLANYGSFSAYADADLKATGNFTDAENINARGKLSINDFHLGKRPSDDYASFKKLVLGINELNPKNNKYLFDSVMLMTPFFKYEHYDYLDNIERMFGKNGDNIKTAKANPDQFNLIIEIVNYIRELAKNFLQSYYQVHKLSVTNGNVQFDDYSQSEKFSMAINPFSITADSVDKNNRHVNVYLKTGLKPYGNTTAMLQLDPKNNGDFDLSYQMQKLSLPMFNPYLITNTSFGLDRGSLEVKGSWNVRNGIIKSENHLIVIDPRITKRIRKKDAKWIPMPLIMTFIRERGNVIDYEIPITGDLKDPKFHLADVIFDLLKNIFVKPATTPYRMEVKNIENEVEKSFSLKWDMRQYNLHPQQEKFLEKIASFLKDNPEASISVYPLQYEEKEKEMILFFEARKKYFLQINHKGIYDFSDDDSITVEKMSSKDSSFVRYLDNQIKDTMLFTIQQKCVAFLDNNRVNTDFKILINKRESSFLSCFKKNNTSGQIKIYDSENDIPYSGFSYYKISYKGDLPNSLRKAYEKLNELNEKVPREKYREQRKDDKGVINEAIKTR